MKSINKAFRLLNHHREATKIATLLSDERRVQKLTHDQIIYYALKLRMYDFLGNFAKRDSGYMEKVRRGISAEARRIKTTLDDEALEVLRKATAILKEGEDSASKKQKT